MPVFSPVPGLHSPTSSPRKPNEKVMKVTYGLLIFTLPPSGLPALEGEAAGSWFSGNSGPLPPECPSQRRFQGEGGGLNVTERPSRGPKPPFIPGRLGGLGGRCGGSHHTTSWGHPNHEIELITSAQLPDVTATGRKTSVLMTQKWIYLSLRMLESFLRGQRRAQNQNKPELLY